MNANQQLLAAIDAFLANSGMAASTFGKKAAGNSEVVARLRDGCSITLTTADRIRNFIAEQRGRNGRAKRRVA